MRAGRNTVPQFDGQEIKCPGCGRASLLFLKVTVCSLTGDGDPPTCMIATIDVGNHLTSTRVDTSGGGLEEDARATLAIQFRCTYCSLDAAATDLVILQKGLSTEMKWK